MKKTTVLLLALAVCAWAAEFWQTKPYTDWNEKEVQKLETSSPWSKQVPVSMGSGNGPDTSRGKRGATGATGDLDSTLGSGSGPGGRGGGGSQEGAGTTPGGGAAVTLTISWRTALPIRQAVAKQRFGDQVGTSADAKKLVEEEQKTYAILVSGLSGRALRGSDKMKESLLQSTSLIVKGKDPIQATDVQTGGNEQRAVVLFLFPRTAGLSLDDKEVEFSTKLGQISLKQKFHLKDMVFNGKLEL